MEKGASQRKGGSHNTWGPLLSSVPSLVRRDQLAHSSLFFHLETKRERGKFHTTRQTERQSDGRGRRQIQIECDRRAPLDRAAR